jgi:hypothetical protein
MIMGREGNMGREVKGGILLVLIHTMGEEGEGVG